MQKATWLRRASWLSAIGVALAAGPALRADDDAPAEQPQPAKDAAPAKDAKEAKESKAARAAEKAVEKVKKYQLKAGGPKYRLGLHLVPVMPALNDQLDLKGEGLVIEHIAPDGPAHKAGIKRHDILLAVGDKPIKSIPDLLEAENASEGKELSLKLLRAGKPMTINVTPAKHEAGEVDLVRKFIPRMGAVDTEEIEELILDKLKQADAHVRMEFLKPGRIFPPGAFFGKGHDFPDDLNVTIRKQGKAPATIEVKQGDNTWTVKEDDLDELPDNVRPHVEALLGHGKVPFTVRFGDDRRPPELPGRGPRPDGPPHDGPPHDGPRAEGPGGPDGPPPIPDSPPRGPEGRRRGGPESRRGPDGPPPERGGRPGGPERDHQTRERTRGALEHRLDELSDRMQQMRRHMDELREIIRREVQEGRHPDDNE